MSIFLKNEYISLSDEELVRLIHNSDDNAFSYLYERYLPKIRTMVYSFQGLGYDIEDLIQEATIGFFTAVNVYDFKSSGFSTFCYICMRRLLLSLIKQNNRKKSIPSSVVIYADETGLDLSSHTNPENEYIAKEDYYCLKDKIESLLSGNERKVLYLYISGLGYKEIAEKLSVDKKYVNNALQRIRKKLR